MDADNRLTQLIDALQDRDGRNEAIKSLAALRDPRAIEALGRVLMTHDEGDAMAYRGRQLAAQALGQIGDPKALTMLLIGLEDEHSSVKVAAARALGQISDPKATQALVMLLDESNPDVREAVLRSIGQIGQAHTVPAAALVPALADMEDSVREVALEIMQGLGNQAIAPLIEAMTHPNSTIRGAAADLLGILEAEEARAVLHQARLDDESRWVRSRAEAALEKLPHDEDFIYKRADGLGIDSPKDVIEKIRRQKADWSNLLNSKKPEPPTMPNFFQQMQQQAPPPVPPPSPEDMTADNIRDLLDQLDVRLVNGDISEATYKRLLDRWQKRLDEIE